ncbi:DJ-1 family protein [uncultured Paludibacter sp.]|nr:DJ-1 family protein [uncultured Paludibacter sp.]
MKAYIFLADGFEEIEAITPMDVLRRAEIKVVTVSISNNKVVTGAHNIPVMADKLFTEINVSGDDYLILPGGIPGTANLMAHEGLNKLVKKQYDAGKEVAAICAAPSLLGKLGILEGKEAISYPGFEKNLIGAKISDKTVVKSENIITAKGPGVAIAFALKIVETIKGKTVADNVANGMCFVI